MFFQADPGTSWAGSIAACMEYPHNRPYTADDLVHIITLLRDPVNGCPWDKVQTHTSIRMNFLEEAYEAFTDIKIVEKKSKELFLSIFN